jgi:hypothetical protein
VPSSNANESPVSLALTASVTAATVEPSEPQNEEQSTPQTPVVDAESASHEAAAPPERYQFHEEVSQALAADAPAMKFANLSPSACRTLASKEKLPVKRDRRPTPGVATAFRFNGPLRGVQFLTAGSRSPFGVMDCRLVLAFDAMAAVLAEHEIAEVHVGTIYRRNSKLRSRKLSQHAHALAADIIAFKLSDGRVLNVEQDFSGQMGAPVCGPESNVEPHSDEAVRLRNLVCALARCGAFHYMLTPNYDRAHHDHIHVDIKRNAKRTVIR